MKHFLRFFLSLIPNLLKSRCKFVRLTPNKKGRIYFLSKINWRIFYVHSRGNTDSCVSDQIFSEHEYSLRSLKRQNDIIEEYNSIIKSGKQPLIIDCGANIGISSLYFSIMYPDAKIIAVEPDIDNFNQAVKNCHSVKNVTVLNKAISSRDGFVDIISNTNDATGHRTAHTDDEDGIPSTSINSIINVESGLVPFIIKVDIEGFEDTLFSDNTDWISACMLLTIELHDWMLPKSKSSQTFLKTISNHDRDFVIRGENIFSIRH